MGGDLLWMQKARSWDMIQVVQEMSKRVLSLSGWVLSTHEIEVVRSLFLVMSFS